MAHSVKHTPSHGISDSGANHTRRLRRKARRNHNKRVMAALMAFADVDKINEAADGTVFMSRQEADGNHWGKGYFGHLMAEEWYAARGAKYLRK